MKKIQILGPGCPKCHKLASHASQAADELELNYELIKVTDLREIAGFGVMLTPAMAIDGDVRVVGAVPEIDELKKYLA